MISATSLSVFEIEALLKRTMQYIKDRTKECFDDYFPCPKKCKLKHVQQWLNLFADYYNKKEIIS